MQLVILDDLPKIMTQMCKGGFKDPEEYFNEIQPMKYHFYSVLARNISCTEFANQAMELKYQQSLEEFKKFENLQQFINNIHQFYWQLTVLYLDITKTAATPNAWYRLENTTADFNKELDNQINQYIETLKNLKGYPEWQEKVKDECGYEIHMIYNSLISNPSFADVFAKYDKQYFFK